MDDNARLLAIAVLLADPEAINDILETELYLLREKSPVPVMIDYPSLGSPDMGSIANYLPRARLIACRPVCST